MGKSCESCGRPLSAMEEARGRCVSCGSSQALTPDEARTLAEPGNATVSRHAEPEPWLRVGSTVAAYRITGALGRGGMGEVVRAEHVRLHRAVAIKALPPELASSPQRRQRLVREAQASSALNHPHIVTVHDLVAEDGRDYIVMELLDGHSLDQILAQGPLPVETATRYARQIADGLCAAHAAGIVHRDLKPSNVMITSRDQVKLMDFGLAKLAGLREEESNADPLTRAGAVLGTAPYMSPEQANGALVDASSDVFSFGILLYEMLTGERPFLGDNLVETLHRVCHHEPPPAGEVREGVPTALSELTRRTLAKTPAERPATAEVLAELRELSPGGSTVFTGELSPHRASSKRLGRWRLALWAGLALTAVAVGLWVTGSGRNDPPSSRAVGSTSAELSDTPHELTERGFALLERFDRAGHIDQALRSFQASLAQDASFARAYAGLGLAYYLRDGETPDPQWLELAYQNAREAVSLNPDLAEARVVLGTILATRGDFQGARAELDEALVLNPNSAPARRELAMLLLRQGDLEGAEREARAAVAREPQSWYHELVLGIVLYDAAQYDEAEQSFRRSSELAPDSYQPWVNLAAIHQKQGNYGEAAAALQQALKHRPLAAVYSNLGGIYYWQGLYRRAADAYQRSVELGPNNYLRWSNLGDAYRRLPGEESRAEEAFARALQLIAPQLQESPDDPTLTSRNALLLAKGRDHAAALLEAERAESLAEGSPAVLYRLVQTYEIAGERAKALDALQRALEAGYPLDEIQREAELANLRQDAAYHRIVMRWDAG